MHGQDSMKLYEKRREAGLREYLEVRGSLQRKGLRLCVVKTAQRGKTL